MGKLAELLNGSPTSHRRMRDPKFRQAQEDGLRLPHVASINALVDELRRAKALDMPYVAPACGGVDAEFIDHCPRSRTEN